MPHLGRPGRFAWITTTPANHAREARTSHISAMKRRREGHVTVAGIANFPVFCNTSVSEPAYSARYAHA